MKWFTHEWPTAGWDATSKAYSEHIAELRPHLPSGLTRLSEGGGLITLHDGWFIDALKEYENPDTILFDVRCWDMAEGRLIDNVMVYPMLHVRIRYEEAKLVNPGWDKLRAARGSAEILYGEFDRSGDDRFVHRMLLWPESEGHVEVEFATAEVVVVRLDGAGAEVL